MSKTPKTQSEPRPWYGEVVIDHHDLERPSLLPILASRIAIHSPEIVIGIKKYFEESGQDIHSRRPYDGTDASSKLFIVLLESLTIFEQLRFEIKDQVTRHQFATGGHAPSHLLMAMTELVELEANLLQSAKLALDTHLSVWNAHDVPDAVEEKKSASDIIGRWQHKDP